MTPQQRWDATPAELAERFAAVAAERLEMTVADLRDLGPGPTIVAEGPQLFPDLIAPLMEYQRRSADGPVTGQLWT